jgi:hypothetical protein
LQKFNGYLFAFPIYDYKIAWKARVRLIDYRTTDGFSRIVAGCVDWYPGFGFELKGRNLYGAIYNASDWFYTDSLKAWGGNIDEIIELKAIFYPAEKIEFYINDVLEDTYSVVANLPAGVSEESPLISLYIENMGEAAEGHIRISRFEIEQYA